jgi:hypothetical protein
MSKTSRCDGVFTLDQRSIIGSPGRKPRMNLPEPIEYEYRFTEYDYEYDEIRCDV